MQKMMLSCSNDKYSLLWIYDFAGFTEIKHIDLAYTVQAQKDVYVVCYKDFVICLVENKATSLMIWLRFCSDFTYS